MVRMSSSDTDLFIFTLFLRVEAMSLSAPYSFNNIVLHADSSGFLLPLRSPWGPNTFSVPYLIHAEIPAPFRCFFPLLRTHSVHRAVTECAFKWDPEHLHVLHCCKRQPHYPLSTPKRSHPALTRALTLKFKGEKALLALLCQEEHEQDYF